MRQNALALLLIAACKPSAATDGSDTDAGPPGASATSPQVDATCVDGAWTETLPDPSASLSAVSLRNDAAAYVEGILDVRYPVGAYIFAEGLASGGFGGGGQDCLQSFTSESQRSSASSLQDAASTLVHECGHFLDIAQGGFSSAAYVVTDTLTLTCSGGSMNETPARSRILQDAYASLRPACASFAGGDGCDSYAPIYLSGNPDDRQFDSGDQGIDTLLEETFQYVNSLATDYALSDRLGAGGAVSARDGILTFLWYTERYLRWTRLNDSQTYDRLMADSCWREAILTLWGRAWLYLNATSDIGALGIDDAELEGLVLEPDLLQEIQRVRDAEGC